MSTKKRDEIELRRRRIHRLFDAADRLAALPEPSLTEREVDAEIQATRADRPVKG